MYDVAASPSAPAAAVAVSRCDTTVADGDVDGCGAVITITGLMTCLPTGEVKLSCPPINGIDPDFKRGPTYARPTGELNQVDVRPNANELHRRLPCRATSWSICAQQHAWLADLLGPYS